ncbi:MAG: gamma-glutamyltransferase [SAR202 cluster bacterium]|nr:gamma-glutamyltransferase [SAR202 cluster bacterium]
MQFNSRRSNVKARNGMVATSQPLAAMAGLRIMLQGGNAVDAAVAAAATLNVVEPESTGMGGDLFALVWTAKDKKMWSLNASGRAPAAASLEQLRKRGWTAIPDDSSFSITVPGTVSGWEALSKRFGSMPLNELLSPAIEYAQKGYPASEVIAGRWVESVEKLKARPSGTELLVNGRAPRPGQVVKLAELGKSLKAVAEGGSEAFYKGPLAIKIAKAVQEAGGWMAAEDLARHEATWVEPISTDYKGVKCWECPPNDQGLNALMALGLARGFDFKAMGFQTADTYHHLIECMRLAFADGARYIADPAFAKVPTKQLLSYAYADKRRKLIRRDAAIEHVVHGEVPGNPDTVYLSAVDGKGNACSLINSLFFSFGSGLVVPGTGIALHNRGSLFSLDPDHPNALAPGKRPFHTIIPGMATRNDELWLCYGVMGGMQQAQGHLQVMVNMVDFGLGPQEALNAPRFKTSLDQGTNLESLTPPGVADELVRRGHWIAVLPPDGLTFGSGQVIERDPETEVLTGASEPRTDGAAVGW